MLYKFRHKNKDLVREHFTIRVLTVYGLTHELTRSSFKARTGAMLKCDTMGRKHSIWEGMEQVLRHRYVHKAYNKQLTYSDYTHAFYCIKRKIYVFAFLLLVQRCPSSLCQPASIVGALAIVLTIIFSIDPIGRATL